MGILQVGIEVEECVGAVLIAGGAGFIGSNLVHYRLDTTADVTVSVDALYAGNLQNLAAVVGRPRHIFLCADIGTPTPSRRFSPSTGRGRSSTSPRRAKSTARSTTPTRSSRPTSRGLHYQIKQSQGKLVRVVTGRMFDVAVDMRHSSPTFGRWAGVELSADNHCDLWVPPGFAHGSDTADFFHQTTDDYAPQHEVPWRGTTQRSRSRGRSRGSRCYRRRTGWGWRWGMRRCCREAGRQKYLQVCSISGGVS